MKRWGLFGSLLVLISRDASTSSSVTSQSSSEALENYIVNLEKARDKCYSQILLLGTLNEKQLQFTKIELNNYLTELSKIKNTMPKDRLKSEVFIRSIALDSELIERTIRAIDTKEEYYIFDLMDIYQKLVKYQVQLKNQIIKK